MTVEAIKAAVESLSAAEMSEFCSWLDERREAEWDRQMEADFSPGGRGYFLLEEVKADIAAGRTRPLDDVLNENRTLT